MHEKKFLSSIVRESQTQTLPNQAHKYNSGVINVFLVRLTRVISVFTKPHLNKYRLGRKGQSHGQEKWVEMPGKWGKDCKPKSWRKTFSV